MKQFSQSLDKILDFVGGTTEEEKITRLATEFARYHLLESQQAINRFEAQYGMTFSEFSDWLKQQSQNVQFRHDLERTFMEWEGQEAARHYWLDALKETALQAPLQTVPFQSATRL